MTEPAHGSDGKLLCDWPGCDKSFSRKADLSRHVRTHTEEKPVPCTQLGCGKSFTLKHYLDRHARTHTGERPYSCTQPGCNKAFAGAEELKVHARTHTGEKPFACDSCDQAFSQQAHLIAHVRIHTGERPYPCQSCDLSFAVSSNLAQHVLTHDKELEAFKRLRAKRAVVSARYNDKVREITAQLRVEFGCQEEGKEGMCDDCGLFPATDLHHLQPERKGKGSSRKGSYASQGLTPTDEGTFSHMKSVRQIAAELERNTDELEDGTKLAHFVALDGGCHAARHFSDSTTERGKEQQERLDFMNAHKRSNGGRCQARNCPAPQLVCVVGNEPLFDLDHLHPKDCVCGQPDCIPKLAGISDMARLPVVVVVGCRRLFRCSNCSMIHATVSYASVRPNTWSIR